MRGYAKYAKCVFYFTKQIHYYSEKQMWGCTCLCTNIELRQLLCVHSNDLFGIVYLFPNEEKWCT